MFTVYLLNLVPFLPCLKEKGSLNTPESRILSCFSIAFITGLINPRYDLFHTAGQFPQQFEKIKQHIDDKHHAEEEIRIDILFSTYIHHFHIISYAG